MGEPLVFLLGGGGGGSHVARLNFKTSRVGVYKCVSLIVGFAVAVASWPREVVSCRDFILRAALLFGPCRLSEFTLAGPLSKSGRIHFICETFKNEGLCYPPCLRYIYMGKDNDFFWLSFVLKYLKRSSTSVRPHQSCDHCLRSF